MTTDDLIAVIAKAILWAEGCPTDDIPTYAQAGEYLDAAILCARDIGAIT